MLSGSSSAAPVEPARSNWKQALKLGGAALAACVALGGGLLAPSISSQIHTSPEVSLSTVVNSAKPMLTVADPTQSIANSFSPFNLNGITSTGTPPTASDLQNYQTMNNPWFLADSLTHSNSVPSVDTPKVHHTTPPAAYNPVRAKGDYVAHGVNFSNLMSDEEFSHWDSMDQPGIQKFLTEQNSFLKNYKENGKSAAQIIADAAKTNHVNPMIILGTLEKESGLVSRTTAAPHWLMQSSMGFAFSDGGGTAGRHSGFEFQVENGTQLLKQLFDEGSAMKMPTRKTVDFDHHTIKVDNAATWALLRYTPHTVDTSLGTVGGGNYLFHYIYNDAQARYAQLISPTRPV